MKRYAVVVLIGAILNVNGAAADLVDQRWKEIKAGLTPDEVIKILGRRPDADVTTGLFGIDLSVWKFRSASGRFFSIFFIAETVVLTQSCSDPSCAQN
jgi:hypothetical protein